MTNSSELKYKSAGIKPESVDSILIIGSIGIGNLLLFSGGLTGLRREFPGAKISIVVLKESFKTLYANDDRIDRIIVLDANKTRTFGQKIAKIFEIRSIKPQVCMTTFPANRLEYNLLAVLTGAGVRIAHKYDSKGLKTLSFLQNFRVEIDKSVHDFKQNLNLLRPLNVDVTQKFGTLELRCGDKAEKEAEAFLHENQLGGFIGIHPGSSIDRGMIFKRWPIKHFGKLCDWLAETYKIPVLLFGGPEEMPLREEIKKASTSAPMIVTELDFLTTASVIGKAAFFVSNDSGLMHVAVAGGTKTIALFGPSDSGRTSPLGEEHYVVRLGLDCSPCWSINNLGVGDVKCVHAENICMTQMSVDGVTRQIKKIVGQIEEY